jgi:hypothetical protein
MTVSWAVENLFTQLYKRIVFDSSQCFWLYEIHMFHSVIGAEQCTAPGSFNLKSTTYPLTNDCEIYLLSIDVEIIILDAPLHK